jgi:hypothetical protein
MKLIKITHEEAKKAYCNGYSVYITTDRRKEWRIPASYEYGSHAPAEVLFARSIPTGEGIITFYK